MSHLEPDPDPGPSEHKLSFLVPQSRPMFPAPVTMNTVVLKSVPGLPELVEGVIMIRELLGYNDIKLFLCCRTCQFLCLVNIHFECLRNVLIGCIVQSFLWLCGNGPTTDPSPGNCFPIELLDKTGKFNVYPQDHGLDRRVSFPHIPIYSPLLPSWDLPHFSLISPQGPWIPLTWPFSLHS